MIETLKKKLWTFKNEYNKNVGIVKGLTKGLKKLCTFVWTLHVPLLVHRTMLSPTRSYKRGSIKWGGNKWSGNRWFISSNHHTFGFLDLTHDSKIEAWSKHIDVQRGIVEMCKKLIVEWKALFSTCTKAQLICLPHLLLWKIKFWFVSDMNVSLKILLVKVFEVFFWGGHHHNLILNCKLLQSLSGFL